MSAAKPLINFRPYQEEAFLCQLGMLFLVWARQRGKSYYLAGVTLDWMMAMPGVLVTIVSAAIRLGEENIRKEATIWRNIMTTLRLAAQASGQYRLTTSADDDNGELLEVDKIADLFQSQKLRTQLWFDNVTHSRSMVIAPNPDTAVGNTGHIILDEVGRMPEFQLLMEAILPFMASNPDYNLRGATTPPPDDTHYSYELLAPIDPDHKYPVNPRGNFYRSQGGLLIHRVDTWDGTAAGVPIYDEESRKPTTPEESRAKAFDKDAWDRNFACKFIRGGTAALGLAELLHAMQAGAHMGTAINITEELRAA